MSDVGSGLNSLYNRVQRLLWSHEALETEVVKLTGLVSELQRQLTELGDVVDTKAEKDKRQPKCECCGSAYCQYE